MRVATVGDNCMDVYTNLGLAYPGGNPVNVAVYMKRLGVETSYVGVVGNDDYGKIIKEAMMDKGINIEYVRKLPGETAISLVELIDGDRVLGDYYEGVLADFELDDEEINFLLEHDLIHTGIWGKVENDLNKLYNRGSLISFDFANKLHHEIVEKSLPYIDYGFFSYIQDDEFIRDYIVKAQKKGPKVVVATLGENGSIAWDGKRFTNFGIVPVKVVDTMGAGDSYIAGFMKGILMNKSIEECMKLGAESSSYTIRYNGAW